MSAAMSILTADSPAELKADNEQRRQAVMAFALRYGVALAAVGLSLLIKLYLKRHMEMGMEQEAPFMLSLAAVMVSGWYGGLGPGLSATILAVLIGDYFFMEPFHALGLITTAQKIPTQYGVTGGGNDGSAFVQFGTTDVAMGWPLRYSHSPAEVIDVRDVDALARAVTTVARSW